MAQDFCCIEKKLCTFAIQYFAAWQLS